MFFHLNSFIFTKLHFLISCLARQPFADSWVACLHNLSILFLNIFNNDWLLILRTTGYWLEFILTIIYQRQFWNTSSMVLLQSGRVEVCFPDCSNHQGGSYPAILVDALLGDFSCILPWQQSWPYVYGLLALTVRIGLSFQMSTSTLLIIIDPLKSNKVYISFNFRIPSMSLITYVHVVNSRTHIV